MPAGTMPASAAMEACNRVASDAMEAPGRRFRGNYSRGESRHRIAASTDGSSLICIRPIAARLENQITMTGPNAEATRAVPLL